MIKRIVVGIDTSEHSRVAQAYAFALARRLGATPRRQLTNSGMLPSGSVIRISRTVADRKVYSTVRSA